MDELELLHKTIKAINPSATYQAFSFDNIIWTNDTTPISQEILLAKKAEIETAYTNAEYQRKRKAEYPAIEDQLDDIYHNGIDGWKATIKVTKDKYPKE